MFLRNFTRFNLAAYRNSFAVGRRAVADYNELCFLAGEVMGEHGCYSFSMRPGQCGQASPIPGPLAGLQERDGIRQAQSPANGLAAFLRLVVGRAAHPNIGGALCISVFLSVVDYDDSMLVR